MSHDPTPPRRCGHQPRCGPTTSRASANSEWALAERDRILTTERTTGIDGAAPRRTMSRRVTGSLVTAGALAGVAALSVAVWVGGGGDDAPPAPTGASVEISVLTRPRTAADALPAWVRGQDALRDAKARPATSRRADDLGDRALFVVRTASGGVCLVDAVTGPTAATPNPGGINCQPRAAMKRSFLVTKLDGGSDPRGLTAIGVVPDGFTRVTSGTSETDVHDNVFVLRGADASLPVIADGPAGRRVETLGVIPTYAPAPDARDRLPVAALGPDAPPGSRSQRIGDMLYSVQSRRSGDIAIYRRRNCCRRHSEICGHGERRLAPEEQSGLGDQRGPHSPRPHGRG